MNVIESSLRDVIEYATDPTPTRADTLRMSRRLYRSLHSPPVDVGDDLDVRGLDLSLRIREALDRDTHDDPLESDRSRLVAMLVPPPAPLPSSRPPVIRSRNPFESSATAPPPPTVPVTTEALRASAVLSAPAGDRRALMSTCAYGYAVLDCDGTRASRIPAREPVLRRTEELVRRIRLLIVENEELKDWIDHVELHRDRVERNMQREIRDLRQRVRELEGYVIALEAGMYQGTVDPARLASTVKNAGTASRLLVGVTENVVAGLILGGVAIGGLAVGGISSSPPLPPSVSIEITNACDNVLLALDVQVDSTNS